MISSPYGTACTTSLQEHTESMLERQNWQHRYKGEIWKTPYHLISDLIKHKQDEKSSFGEISKAGNQSVASTAHTVYAWVRREYGIALGPTFLFSVWQNKSTVIENDGDIVDDDYLIMSQHMCSQLHNHPFIPQNAAMFFMCC